MLFSRALYYPSIDIKNDRWLKSAILFWDSIETIVPQSRMDRPYENSTARVLFENNILRPHFVNPFADDVVDLESDVRRFIVTREGKRLLCKRWFNVSAPTNEGDRLHGNKMSREAFLNNWRERSRGKYGEFFIHIEKLPHFLHNELCDYVDQDGFVASTPEFVGFYMTLLANNICRRNNLSLLTDKVMANDLSNKMLKEMTGVDIRVNVDTQNLQCMLYRIVIDNILVNPTTTIDKIVKFKEKYKDELCRYRQEVSKLTNIDLDLTTFEAVSNQVGEIYKNAVIPSLNDLKKALRGYRIKWVSDHVYNYVVSGMAPAALKMAELPLSYSIPISTGLTIGYTLLGAWQAKKDIMRTSPYSYLIRINRKFSVNGRYK